MEGPIHEMPKELTKPINDTSMGDITSESDKIASGDKLEADFEESDYRNKELVSKPSYLKLSTRKDALFKTLSSPATAPTMHLSLIHI